MRLRRRLGLLLAVLPVVAAACSGEPDASSDAGDASSRPGDTAPAGGSGSDEPAEEAVDDPGPTTEIEEGPKATLTGLPADADLAGTPAVVVKVSNNDDRSLAALIGIERADLVIEERIEDRATRFAAIYHSDLPELVGPVRSARTTDLDLLRNLGTPILVFSGANIAVMGSLRDLALESAVVLVVNDDSETYHYRDGSFDAPDNLFTDPALVAADFAEAAGAPRPVVSFRAADTDTRPASISGTGFTVEGRDTVSFVYVDAVGYVRVQDDAIHVTREGAEITVTNVVVMETEYVQNAADAQSIDAITVGEGAANILIGGRRWEGRWSRATANDPYVFRTAEGAEILLEPGRTWITLVPADTYEFSTDPAIRDLVERASR